MSRLAVMVLAAAGLVAWLGPRTWTGASEADPRPVLGKPTAPAEIDVLVLESSPGAGRFEVELRVTAQADHEALMLTAWSAPGVRVDAAEPVRFGPGEAGRQATWRLAGEWTGEGPPRVYVQAELSLAAGSVSRRLAVTVSEADFRREAQGRLDAANGVLAFEVK